MECLYISIERNIEGFEFYKSLWKAYGVEGIRADTMSEGIKRAIEIEKLHSKAELYFIAIVADDVNYMPQLKMLREETNAPILIAVSKENYTEKQHHESLRNGANFYAPYCEKPETDISGVLSAIESVRLQDKKRKPPSRILAHGDILVDIKRHKAFFKDKEVVLAGTEMRILHYLMLNRGITLNHEQIFQNTYNDYENVSADSLYSAIKRLRKKIRDVVQTDYIETVREVGYRLMTNGCTNQGR
jgi:DNA-binding response OmpR family regulator